MITLSLHDIIIRGLEHMLRVINIIRVDPTRPPDWGHARINRLAAF
jgi:hypothetical protein